MEVGEEEEEQRERARRADVAIAATPSISLQLVGQNNEIIKAWRETSGLRHAAAARLETLPDRRQTNKPQRREATTRVQIKKGGKAAASPYLRAREEPRDRPAITDVYRPNKRKRIVAARTQDNRLPAFFVTRADTFLFPPLHPYLSSDRWEAPSSPFPSPIASHLQQKPAV